MGLFTSDDAGRGLVPPAVATHLMGEGGSMLILVCSLRPTPPRARQGVS